MSGLNITMHLNEGGDILRASERRVAIMRKLHTYGSEKVSNLAAEFDVSERTIRRDISILSSTEPIYTQSGRYTGGIYIVHNRSHTSYTLSHQEVSLLKKLLEYLQQNDVELFSHDEIELLSVIILKYTNSN